jgi:hypothetical protein
VRYPGIGVGQVLPRLPRRKVLSIIHVT